MALPTILLRTVRGGCGSLVVIWSSNASFGLHLVAALAREVVVLLVVACCFLAASWRLRGVDGRAAHGLPDRLILLRLASA